MKLTAISALGAVLVALAACSPKPTEAPKATEPAAPAAPAAPVGAVLTTTPDINAADLAARDKELADDKYEGRGPGTVAGEASAQWIADEMKRIGLEPAVNGSYFQDVDVVSQTVVPDKSNFTIADAKGGKIDFNWGKDVVYVTKHQKVDNVSFKDTDVVFVGYGVNAPEEHWNDFAGVDVKGKTIVMFVNDPDFETGQGDFGGKAMTYYGRWTYKFEEAARKGAAAALIVHDTAGASYGWDVVKNSWSGVQYDLPASADPAPRLPAQGWITGDAAKSLFADAGLDLDALRAAANKRGFKAVPMKAKLSLDLKSTIAEKSSRNVVGLLPGATHPDEAVVYMAHWDHLGKHDDEQNAAGTADIIYNGAVDNATGVAGILEIADAFAHQAPKPERSVLFVAVTLEESGLLGSQYYAAHPAIPLDHTVAVVNIDAMSVAGRTRDVTVVGMGSSQLEDILKPIVEKQGRTMHSEAHPEAGGYFRSDHFSFAKAGVPALYMDGGDDLVEGGNTAGESAAKDYGDHRYHAPGDQYDAATWKLDGTMQDLEAEYAVGRELAGSTQWPDWYEGNAFKALRDKAMAGRAAK
jgi:Zn-dependent M28 family amino/carboxypeptidase